MGRSFPLQFVDGNERWRLDVGRGTRAGYRGQRATTPAAWANLGRGPRRGPDGEKSLASSAAAGLIPAMRIITSRPVGFCTFVLAGMIAEGKGQGFQRAGRLISAAQPWTQKPKWIPAFARIDGLGYAALALLPCCSNAISSKTTQPQPSGNAEHPAPAQAPQPNSRPPANTGFQLTPSFRESGIHLTSGFENRTTPTAFHSSAALPLKCL